MEENIKEGMAEGMEPLAALEKLDSRFKLDEATLKLLRRDPVETRFLDLKSSPETSNKFDGMEYVEDPEHGRLSLIDAEYLINCGHASVTLDSLSKGS